MKRTIKVLLSLVFVFAATVLFTDITEAKAADPVPGTVAQSYVYYADDDVVIVAAPVGSDVRYGINRNSCNKEAYQFIPTGEDPLVQVITSAKLNGKFYSLGGEEICRYKNPKAFNEDKAVANNMVLYAVDLRFVTLSCKKPCNTVFIEIIKDGDKKTLSVNVTSIFKKVTAKYVTKAKEISSMFHDNAEFGYILIFDDGKLIAGTDKVRIKTDNSEDIYTYTDLISQMETSCLLKEYSMYQSIQIDLIRTDVNYDAYESGFSSGKYYDITDGSCGVYGTASSSELTIDGPTNYTARLRVPAMKDTPLVRFKPDTVLFTSTSNQQIQVKYGTGAYSSWFDAKKNMTFKEILKAAGVGPTTANAAYEETVIRIRTKSKKAGMPSRMKIFKFAKQEATPETFISFYGKLEGGVIKFQISDCNAGNPYEWTTETPADGVKWNKITKISYTTLTNLKAGSKIYIRKCGSTYNAKLGTTDILPATYLTYTINASGYAELDGGTT